MQVQDHIDALRREGRLLAAAAQEAGPEAAAPSCPKWKVRDVVEHTGGVHRWASHFLTTGASGPTSAEQSASFFVHVPDDELVDWYLESHESLLHSLEDADASTECWTFLPAPSPLAFWARRQAHETAIHRVDVEEACGEASPFEPRFAADGIDELLNGFMARSRGNLVSDPPVTLAVSSTDTADNWTVRIEPEKRVITDGLSSGADCVLRGPAHVLYLFLWNRRPADESLLDVTGDRSLVDMWGEKAKI